MGLIVESHTSPKQAACFLDREQRMPSDQQQMILCQRPSMHASLMVSTLRQRQNILDRYEAYHLDSMFTCLKKEAPQHDLVNLLVALYALYPIQPILLVLFCDFQH